jgi:tRNA U55 pseudouridine synthase TruB
MEEAVAHLPRVTLADSLVRRILHGQPVRLQRTETVWPIGTDVAVFDSGGQLVGVARVTHNGQLKPKVNLGSPT